MQRSGGVLVAIEKAGGCSKNGHHSRSISAALTQLQRRRRGLCHVSISHYMSHLVTCGTTDADDVLPGGSHDFDLAISSHRWLHSAGGTFSDAPLRRLKHLHTLANSVVRKPGPRRRLGRGGVEVHVPTHRWQCAADLPRATMTVDRPTYLSAWQSVVPCSAVLRWLYGRHTQRLRGKCVDPSLLVSSLSFAVDDTAIGEHTVPHTESHHSLGPP